jgi:hypothetical protein
MSLIRKSGGIMVSQSTATSSLLAAALILLAAPAAAHHGLGRFDPTRDLTVEGTLTGLDFVNPHSYVHFDAKQADGTTITMQCDQNHRPPASRRSALLLRRHAHDRRRADTRALPAIERRFRRRARESAVATCRR